MRLLDRYLVREVGGVFIFGVTVFTTLLLVNHLFYIARVASEISVPLRTSLELLVLRIPYLAAYSLPMSMLLATLLAFGRLSERNEVTALRTAGLSLGRIAAPVIATGVFVMLSSLAVTEYVVPPTETRYRDLILDIYRVASRHVRENVMFREPVDGVESIFFARTVDGRDGTMNQVVILQFAADGRPSRMIEAASARWSEEGWSLHDGTLYLLGNSAGVTTKFADLRVGLKRPPAQIVAPRKDAAEMTIAELRGQIAELRNAGESVLRYTVYLHLKFAIPASSVVFTLLAVPLGLRPHRSARSTGLGLTVVVLLGYYILITVTTALGERGQLTPFLAAWAPNLAAGAIGAYLLWTAR
jgi:lipopolysaccharide export system permease protein